MLPSILSLPVRAPQPMQNCGYAERSCQQCCPMAPQDSLMPSEFGAPVCCSTLAPSRDCHQHHDGPVQGAACRPTGCGRQLGGCSSQQHAAFAPPCCAHEAAYPATTTQQCGMAHYPRVAPGQWPAPCPPQVVPQKWRAPRTHVMGFPSHPMFQDTRRKRNRKRKRRASPFSSRRAHQNDDSLLGDTSEDLEDLKPRHKRVRIAKGPTPYAEFESVELSDQREEEREPKNCPMLPLVLVAIVAGIVLIGTAGHVVKSLYAEFPPGGAILYKSLTGSGWDPVRTRQPMRRSECRSESCQWQTRYIANKLNHSVSPCVDFYSYVCSRNWFRKPDASSQPYTYSAHASTMLNLWDFLERVPADGSDSFTSEAALFMQDCVPGLNNDNWNVFRKILQTLGIGEWPYKDASPHAEAHTVAAKAEKMLGVSSLVSVSLRARPLSDKTMLHVNSPPILLRRYKNAFPGPYLKSYGEFIFKAFSLSNPGGQDVHQTVLRILVLEEKISAAAAQSVRNLPVAELTLPIANLTSEPYWDWQAYFQYFIQENKGRLTRGEVALLDSAYFNNLPNIISRFTVQTLLNYVGYKLIVSLSPLLPSNEAEFMMSLLYRQHFANGVPQRLEACFSLLERLYPRATRALTWSQVLKETSTPLTRGIMGGLRKLEQTARHEMRQAAAKAPWMDRAGSSGGCPQNRTRPGGPDGNGKRCHLAPAASNFAFLQKRESYRSVLRSSSGSPRRILAHEQHRSIPRAAFGNRQRVQGRLCLRT
ncbi:hypothetical protein HPB48_011785 [Haemaphysalis longicornis]|uniref:Peptidase M13 N-terminal domain-containing protein n=1 Tax=Haemaphysalis longicornis TaxID=44386 RepID=A0A9J6G8R1_HAELO|nr:hypothetical protein HPB48_011785 [Haemaphysalis longicornis]